MERKVVSGIMLALILVGVLNVPLTVAEVGVDNPKSQIFNGNDLEPFSVGEDLWNFSNIIEWSRFAYVNDNSAEVVIGLSNTQPPSYDRLSSLICKSRGEIVNTVSMGGEPVAFVVNMSVKTASSFVDSVRATGLTKYIEPNMRFQAQLTPNDPYWNLQWGPRKIEAHYAWNTTIGDPSVLVAVIDTGTDYNHTDLVDNYVALGYDWVNNDTDPMDDHGHGTHCAGIIAATLDNNIGIAGVAQVRIMAEKGLDSGGSGRASDLANAIIHAVDQGADILSNSWGSFSYSELIHDAVEYAQDHGVLVVAAAGNAASSMKHYPAAYDEVVAVTATDQSDDPASFTSYGKWVDVAAPGVNVYSTVSEVHDPYFTANYSYANGTSMACPHAAGVAALIWSEFPSLTRDEVRLRLQVTADDLGDLGFDVYYGYGRVNARRAVEPLPSHDLLILNWKRPAYVEPGSSGIINTTVLNFGSNNEAGITVQLRVNGSVVDSAYISSLDSMKSVTVSCSWSPTVDGRYYVESYVVPVSGETVVENNVRSAYINVRVGKFIRVPEDYSRIQEAVDLAGPGETIKVASGTYYERVSIDTSLNLFGEDRDTTVIDGNGIGIVVGVTADSVEIRGFTVQNSGVNLPRGGIVLMGVKNCVVTNNTLINDFEGVLLWECTGNNSVYGNIAFSNEDAGIGSVYSTGRDIISDNAMTGGQFGVAIVSFISGSIVSRNVITNSEYGICICADNNTVVNNTITLCSDCGIWLLFSNNTISDNRVKNNERGILLDFASSNRIYHNDFVHNTIQVYFEVSPSQNTWDDGYPSGGNHWSDYNGVDANQDGIGDTPYIINDNNVDNYPLMHPLATPFYGPLAKFIYSPKTPCVYETVTFNASASASGWNGTARVPIAYTWDFDDGNIMTVTNPVIFHVFTDGGVYTVNLTVTCDDSVLIEEGFASDSTWQDVPVTVTVCIIRADGSVFPPTAPISSVDNVTYTFTGNLNVSVVVQRDNIMIDGAGYIIQGARDSKGIDLTGRSNVTIKNIEIKAFTYGIYLYGSSNNSISENNITDNAFGVWLEDGSSNNICGNNITKNGSFGIVLNSSSNNILSGNNITNNSIGVVLDSSSNNTLSGNMMNGNTYNFGGVWGDELSHFMHSIDASNLVEGKPVYYLVNRKDLVISSATHPQVGFLVLINCANVTVEGLTLTSNVQGLLLAYTNNSRIADNNIIYNNHGIVLYESSNNRIFGNNLINNIDGIMLDSSSGNSIDGNNIKTDSYAGDGWGIYLTRSSNNNITGNTIASNWWGIQLYGASNNSIYHNNFKHNQFQVHAEDSMNVWDDGYPSGGNYWSELNPPDIYSGPFQNETGRDGIGDTPYIINENNTDRYPLIYPYGYVPSPDLNDDGIVDIRDIVLCALAFGSKTGDFYWNPIADVVQDGKINIRDIVTIAIHYGETYP